MSRKFALVHCCLFLCLVMFLCICFINILVSSPTFERGKKENHLNSGDPEEGEQNPEVRSKLALRALPLAAYLVNISTSFLLSKHVNWCRCTLDWPGQAGIEILFVLYFFPRLSSEPLHITCLALMMLLIKCSRSVGGFAWQAWCLSFSEISPPLALSTSHSPTQQHCALDAQPVNSSLANYHL